MREAAFSKKELQAATRRFRDAWLAAIPEPEAEHIFSPSYLAWEEALLKKARRKESLRRALQTAAGIVIAVAILSSVLIASNSYARERVVRWVKQVFEKSVFYRYEVEQHLEEAVLPEADFSKLEGYHFICIGDAPRAKAYATDDGSRIQLTIIAFTNDTQVQLFATDYKCCQTKVNGIDAEFYECFDENSSNMLIWHDLTRQVEYSLSTHLPLKETVELAKSIRFLE